MPARAQPRTEKLSKATVSYQVKASMPSTTCERCVHFRAPRACHLVAGLIAPGGWCDRFLRRAGR